MSMRSMVLIVISCLSTACGSIAGDTQPAETLLYENTDRVEGWFSTKGEWILFPTRNFEAYDPFGRGESQKCVSLINGTGSDRSRYFGLEGEKVVATGFTVRYDSLSSGSSTHDRLLSKKYYENEPVENFCLRDFVFVASSIEPAR